jgi:hypothetical protein
VLAKVTVVKIVSYNTSVCDSIGGDVAAYIYLTSVTLASTNNALPEDCVTTMKHVGAILM